MDDQPALLIIAHDHGCGICRDGRCDCDPTRKVLRGELTMPGPAGLAPPQYVRRLTKLVEVLGKVPKVQV